MNNYATKFLNEIVHVKVDRVLGSKHPKHNIYYSFNYGYLENELAPDGEGIVSSAIDGLSIAEAIIKKYEKN